MTEQIEIPWEDTGASDDWWKVDRESWEEAMEEAYHQAVAGYPDAFHAFVMDNIQESGRFNEKESEQ